MTINAIYIAGSIAIVALVFLVVFLILFRWKFVFPHREGDMAFHLYPDDIVDENARNFKKFKKEFRRYSKHQEKQSIEVINAHLEIGNKLIASNRELRGDQERINRDLQNVLATFRDLREETQILRQEIQTQAAELERHRKGYDVDILSSALAPIARMHRVLQEDLSSDELPDGSKQTLAVLEDEYLGVLEMNGVHLVYPSTGDLYRDQVNIKHPPVTTPTSKLDLVGKIASVTHPAYELKTTARDVVLLPAIVEIYTAAEIEVDAEDSNLDQGMRSDSNG